MKIKDNLFKYWVILSGITIIFLTFGVFIFLLVKGINVISFEFIMDSPKGIPLGTEGGIFPAIVGSLLSGALSGLMGGILGLCTAIYLVFYCYNKRLKKTIIMFLQCLAGIPSIVIGMFGYTFMVVGLDLKRSLISASLTLTIMIVPFISIKLKKALEETSKNQFISSLSLGVSKSYSIIHLVIPNALGSIMTSLGLSIVFAMGATAPIMLTGAVIIASSPTSLTDPIMALPYHLYVLVNEGLSLEKAYGTAFVLIILLLIINLVCHLVGYLRERAICNK